MMRYAAAPLIALTGCTCLADPGFVTGGGQPQVVSGQTTVRMKSEKVTLTVLADRVNVDGTFEFDNPGPACKVRMGFPETASFPFGGRSSISTIFAHYRCYVDGARAATKLLPGKNPDEKWDVQSVSFAAAGHRTIRVLYSTSLGGFAGDPPTALTSYTLHTGGSWNGPIGSVIIDVKFTDSTELARPFDIWHGSSDQLKAEIWQTQPAKRGGVIAVGPGSVREDGDTLRYECTNFKPTAKDDILIVFRYPPKQLAKISKPGATTPVVPPR